MSALRAVMIGTLLGVSRGLVSFAFSFAFRLVRSHRRFKQHQKSYDAAAREMIRCKSIGAADFYLDQMDAAIESMKKEVESV